MDLLASGSGYSDDINVTVPLPEGVSGSEAVMSATVHNGVITSIPVLNGGSGYSGTDLVNVFDLQNEATSGFGARVIPVVDETNGSITELKVLSGGQNYDLRLPTT